MSEDNVLEKITIYNNMMFYNKQKFFSKGYKLLNSFTIDLINKKIISENSSDGYQYEIESVPFHKALKNFLTQDVDLKDDKLNEFIKGFVNLNLKETSGFYIHEKTLFNVIFIYYKGCDAICCDMSNLPDKWIKLGELLYDLVGFDILNIENSLNYLVTNMTCDFKQDGVYDKRTSEKLKLKSLRFDHSTVFNSMPFTYELDFENKKCIMVGFMEMEVSDEILNAIFNLLEKYHVYQLDDKRYWQKFLNHRRWVLDGYSWSLQLTFEDDKNWLIGNHNEYPDIFCHIAHEIIDLTGEDYLKISYISEKEQKLYKEYGDKILGLK